MALFDGQLIPGLQLSDILPPGTERRNIFRTFDCHPLTDKATHPTTVGKLELANAQGKGDSGDEAPEFLCRQ